LLTKASKYLAMPKSAKCITGPASVIIRSFLLGTSDADAFRSLNEEWISRFFKMEAKDFEVLLDPEGAILKHGGHIYMAELGAEAVGCVALELTGEAVYEVSKMAVAPNLRGHGVGRCLLEYAIEEARTLGAESLWLGSNTRLESAIHLYESVGFRHLPPERKPNSPYSRANVFMEKRLK